MNKQSGTIQFVAFT